MYQWVEKEYLHGKVGHEKAVLILVVYHEILDVLQDNHPIPKGAEKYLIHVERV
jgi:hypothetical protein